MLSSLGIKDWLMGSSQKTAMITVLIFPSLGRIQCGGFWDLKYLFPWKFFISERHFNFGAEVFLATIYGYK